MEATVIDYEEAKFAHEYKSVASDGYLGAIETTGSKYAEKRLYGTDLSKAIRDDLRKHLAVTKKSNVNVRIETGPMHQHVDVTIKLERDKFAKNWKDALADFMASDRRMPVWIRQSDEEGNNLGDVFNEEYYGMTGKEQEIVRERRPMGDGINLEKLFICDDGFYNLPEDVAEMEIAYIYSEPWGNGDAAIIIEVEQEG